MTLFTIIEVARYEVEAETWEDAELRFLKADPEAQSEFLVGIDERVIDDPPEEEVADAA